MTAQATLQKFKAANQVQVNDTTRRFGYSGGVPYLTVQPKYAGVGSAMVPGGTLITFAPELETIIGTYSEQQKRYISSKRMITPAEQVLYVAKKFHVGMDAGFRELKSLTRLPYEVIPADPQAGTPDQYYDEGPAYFNTLHVPLTCDMGLESIFVSRAEGNVGAEWYQACPTCRLKDLESDACTARIRASNLDPVVLNALREELITANRSAIIFAEMQIARVDADLEKRGRGEHGRTYRYEVDHIYYKMVHRQAQEIKQLSPQEIIIEASKAAAAGVIAAQAANPAQAPAPLPTPEEVVDPEFQEFLADQFAAWQAKKAAEATATAETVTAPKAGAKTKAKEKTDGGSADPVGDEGNA